MPKIEGAIDALIAAYPTRWKQAVANPNLRWWFVRKAQSNLNIGAMIDRVAISAAVDRRAASHRKRSASE